MCRKIFEEIKAEKFPNQPTNPRSSVSPRKNKFKENHSMHIRVKVLKSKVKRENCKSSQKKVGKKGEKKKKTTRKVVIKKKQIHHLYANDKRNS